jgi:hypothetical protein
LQAAALDLGAHIRVAAAAQVVFLLLIHNL